MAYCRFSSDRHGCDVYVYADVHGGYTCHVAGRRIVNLHEAPHCPDLIDYPRGEDNKITDEALADFMVKHRAYMDWLQNDAIRENIGLEFDGETFNTETATSMGNELKLLQTMGYSVPEYAIETLWEEGKENGEQPDEDWLNGNV
jgi:hypothetical protein